MKSSKNNPSNNPDPLSLHQSAIDNKAVNKKRVIEKGKARGGRKHARKQ